MSKVNKIIDGVLELIRPPLTFTYNRLYMYYNNWESYFQISNEPFIIHMNYNKIDVILLNGKSIKWSTRKEAPHPLEGVITSDENIVEIQYSNYYTNHRIILENNILVTNFCNEIIWTTYPTEIKKEFIIYAKICFASEEIEYTKEINEYLDYDFSDSDAIIPNLFQWDKMYYDEKPLKDCKIFFITWKKKEFTIDLS